MLHVLLPLLATVASAPPMLLVPTTAPDPALAQAVDGRLRVAADLTFLDETTTATVLEDGRALGVACDAFDVSCLGKLGSLAEVERVVNVIVSDAQMSGGGEGALVIVNVVDTKTGEARRRTAQVTAGATNIVDVAVDTARAAVLGDAAVSATDAKAARLPPALIQTPSSASSTSPAETPASSSSSSGLPLGVMVGGAGLAVGALAGIGAGGVELLLGSPSGTYEDRGAWQVMGRGLIVVAGVGLVVAGAGLALLATD